MPAPEHLGTRFSEALAGVVYHFARWLAAGFGSCGEATVPARGEEQIP